MSKISCSACGRIHERNYVCEAKKKIKLDKSRRDRGREDNKIFSSGKWKMLRKNIVEDYNNIDMFSFYVLGKIEVAEVVHHIVEFMQAEELAYDYDNLIPLSNHTHLSIVHKLYKTNCKNDIQQMLIDICKDYWNDMRELGSYKERYNKIVKDFGMNV